jgi:hypothetical protein
VRDNREAREVAGDRADDTVRDVTVESRETLGKGRDLSQR